jgi:hypothetical protein
MKSIGIKRIVSTLTLLGFTAVASAQYIWLDEKGVKQFSDVPPPASVPQKRILKQPGQTYFAPQSSSDDAASDTSDQKSSSPDKPSAPLTTAEKNAEFMKRRAKQAEQEAKAAAEAKNAAAKAKNCENARNYYRSLTSGERIMTRDSSGERAFLSDEQRAREEKETKAILNDCK